MCAWGEPRLLIVLLYLGPITYRKSASLVVPFSDGTTSLEVMDGLAVLAFFVDRIAFSATIWEVPWHVHVRIRPPRCPGVSPQCRFAIRGHKNETPNTPEKGPFMGQIL